MVSHSFSFCYIDLFAEISSKVKWMFFFFLKSTSDIGYFAP